MTRPKLLDLFCCAGGAGMGYHQAGFDVVGVDLAPQPRYPFEFVQADVLGLDPTWIASFDAIHASPPCQAHSALRTMHNARDHADLVPQTREMLKASGLPWVMENVPGAPLEDPITLCGTMFGLGVDDAELRRHRLFETSFHILLHPACQHGSRDVIGVYGEGIRDARRRQGSRGVPDFSIDQGRAAMGIDWMTTTELSQAIPPAYTRYLGERMLEHMRHERAAA